MFSLSANRKPSGVSVRHITFTSWLISTLRCFASASFSTWKSSLFSSCSTLHILLEAFHYSVKENRIYRHVSRRHLIFAAFRRNQPHLIMNHKSSGCILSVNLDPIKNSEVLSILNRISMKVEWCWFNFELLLFSESADRRVSFEQLFGYCHDYEFEWFHVKQNLSNKIKVSQHFDLSQKAVKWSNYHKDRRL